MNRIVNGSFLDNIASWDVFYALGLGPPTWTPVGNPGGSMKIRYDGTARQSVLVEDLNAEYVVRFSLSVPEPGTAVGDFYVRVVTGGATIASLSIPTPLADAGWYEQVFTFLPTNFDVRLEFENEYGGPYCLIDNVVLERVAVSPLQPLVAELQKRRRDMVGVKHALARYGESLEVAVDNAPRHLWKHNYVDIQGYENVQRYSFNADDLVNPDHIFRVGLIRSDDSYAPIGRYTVMPDTLVEGWVELRLDEADWLPTILRIEYQGQPQYDFSLPDDLPLDREWILAETMVRLLLEAEPEIEPIKALDRDMVYWTDQRNRREMSLIPRFPPDRPQTLAPRRWAIVRDPSTAPTVASALADFTGSPSKSYQVPLTVTFVDRSQGAVSWLYDFGDGTTSTEQNPVKTYYAVGKYTVIQTVTGAGGDTDSLARVNFIQVGVPQANFEMDPSTGPWPLLVAFNNTTIFNEPEGNLSWLWNFSDGYTSVLKNPTHTFANAGTYSVVLTATGSVGSDTIIKPIVVTEKPTPPTVDFDGVPVSGNIPLTVKFTPTISDSYTSLLWQFGDDTTSTETEPEHIYTVEDVYTVVLTVVWEGGAPVPRTKTDYITALAAGEPVADFYALVTEALVNENIQFLDLSTPGDITDWAYDFGDTVGTSILPSPVYAYPAAGTYSVELEVTSPGGTNSKTILNYITVTEPPSTRVSGEIWMADFNEGSGAVVNDRTASPYNLALTGDYTWNPSYGSIIINGESIALGTGAATKINNAVIASDELTVELWLKSADAGGILERMIDLAVSTSNVNVQMQQDGSQRYRGLLKSTTSNADGTPRLETAISASDPENKQHLVMRRLTDHTWDISIDNVQVVEGTRDGSLTWDAAAVLAMFNQVDGTRVWKGEMYLAAIYDWALSDEERAQNFYAGSEGTGPPPPPGDDFYISPTGSDSSGDGSFENPWKTVSYGISQLSASETLYLLGGTYDAYITSVPDGVTDSHTIIAGYPGGTPILNHDQSDKSIVELENTSYVTFKNLELSADCDDDVNVFDIASTCDNITLEDVDLYDLRAAPLDKSTESSTRTSFKRQMGDRILGLLISGDDVTLTRVTTWGFQWGMSVKSAPQQLHVYDSKFMFSSQHGLTFNNSTVSEGEQNPTATMALFERCIIEDAGSDGFQTVNPHPNYIGGEDDDSLAHKYIVFRDCVFRDCGENAFDPKAALGIMLDGCVFYRIMGSNDGYRANPWNASTFTVTGLGSGTTMQWMIMRNNFFVDCAPAQFIYGKMTPRPKDIKYYNNTMLALNYCYTGTNQDDAGHATNLTKQMLGIRQADGASNELAVFINNLIANQNFGPVAFELDSDPDIDYDYNLYHDEEGAVKLIDFNTNTDYDEYAFAAWVTHCASFGVEQNSDEADPLFVDTLDRPDTENDVNDALVNKGSDLVEQLDIRLQSGSPARNKGGPLTTAAANSSGTTVEVVDAKVFYDGWGITDETGDQIMIDVDATVYTILSINYTTNVLTLDGSPSVTIGDPVYMAFLGTAPDIGAYEYVE